MDLVSEAASHASLPTYHGLDELPEIGPPGEYFILEYRGCSVFLRGNTAVYSNRSIMGRFRKDGRLDKRFLNFLRALRRHQGHEDRRMQCRDERQSGAWRNRKIIGLNVEHQELPVGQEIDCFFNPAYC